MGIEVRQKGTSVQELRRNTPRGLLKVTNRDLQKKNEVLIAEISTINSRQSFDNVN